jgi:ribonuclease III
MNDKYLILLNKLEKVIGIEFKNKKLLLEAITHRSYLNENPKFKLSHNERLEYLGDAVLELAVSEFLFLKYSKFKEGELTLLRSSLVNYQNLAKVAKNINLDKFILTSRGEKKDTDKAWQVILANALEALIGAIYLDKGFNIAKKFIQKFIIINIDEILKLKSYKDPKSKLQEIIQDKFKITPTYEILKESGPPHQRTFSVGVYFDKDLIEKGSGSSKQEAEMDAAKKALKKIGEE